METYLRSRLEREGALHLTLIDPDKVSPSQASLLAKVAAETGSAAIMVGGSLGVSEGLLDDVILAVKEADLPVIIFPSNATTLSKHADAVWFISLLNSSNPYFIIDAQMLGASIIRKYGLEPLPTGYLVLNQDTAVGFVGQARPIPVDRPEIAVLYALTAQYLGMRFLYLEGGSGAKSPVPARLISEIKRNVELVLIVGGGIRSGGEAKVIVEAGADMIVTGTVVEERGARVLEEVIAGVREGARNRHKHRRVEEGTCT
ncbi:MAG: geranylgeranylglyceryl/heptaprenylglyceryl phosphate synthase [Candidatus Nezhaarchaeota archaeon]|nr:geranylgeranylglyceryl/heptaprenylglyceryl phosphate synthase [Candidatus Nezhaarchaeota archaeon]